MEEPSPGEPEFQSPREERLASWKDIAAYLQRDVTTVQRWEKREGMPVRRHLHDRSSSVYAFRSELDAWMRQRSAAEPAPPSRQPEAESALDQPAAPATPLVEDEAPRQQAADHRSHRTARWVWASIAAAAAVLAAGSWLANTTDYFWTSPLDGATTTMAGDFDGSEQAAALSPDGRLLAFLSDRDGTVDVWLTQLGSGQFHNLTHGTADGLVNPAVRSLRFSPDGALVAFWRRMPNSASSPGEIGVWAVPTLGGESRPYLDGAAEVDWSSDGTRLVYHTPDAGDPTYVRQIATGDSRPIFRAPAGLHAHFPVWSPRGAYIYFVQGAVGEAMDLWRVKPSGGRPERITTHASQVSHPVLLDERTIVYLATDKQGGGPWIYALDTDRRMPHRLSQGFDRFTSLSASADGRRVAATVTRPKETLWRVALPLSQPDPPRDRGPEPTRATALREPSPARPVRVALTTGHASSPRLGPGYLVFVAPAGNGDALWRTTGETTVQLWNAPGVRILGAPAISPDGQRIAFSAEHDGRSLLVVTNADGSRSRTITDRLDLRGAPAWSPDGRSLTAAAAESGTPRLFRVPLDGGSPVRLSPDHAVGPAWSPDGRFVVFSGPDVGTAFQLSAARPDGSRYTLPNVTLTRGARSLRFLPGGRSLVVLRGDMAHKDLWAIDLDTGTWRQLTQLPAGFNVRDFDISPDGREAVVARVEEQGEVVLFELRRR